MKISLNWLNKYVDLGGLTAQEVANILTDLGLEVEEVKIVSPLDKRILVGHILEAIPHPNADSLRLCTVAVGLENPLTIVCGAANARKGLYVAVATIGAKLPGGLEMKETKIRGQASFGMLCSESELGLAETSEGILELPPAPLGKDIESLLKTADALLTLNVTPNRGDCLSYFGVARELAARLDKKTCFPSLKYKIDAHLDTKKVVELNVSDPSACRRFVAIYVENIHNGESPQWLKKVLIAADMRPINLVVDCTNYVMLETGQPIHAYDAKKIRQKTIGVARVHSEETLRTLDDKDVLLKVGDIIIHDGVGPIGLAGIMGGKDSEVSASTTGIIIEAAHFDPIAIRSTAKRLALHSEASHRFERQTDLEGIRFAAERVADLLSLIATESGDQGPKDVAIPRIANLHEYYPAPFKARNLQLRLSQLCRVSGSKEISLALCSEILSRLKFAVKQENEAIEVLVPSWRNDVEGEVDLIEEVIRVYGYEKISYQLPLMSITPNPQDEFIQFCENIRIASAYGGMSETISFPFQSEKIFALMRLMPTHPLWPQVRAQNPLNDEERSLQTTLLPGLLAGILRNQGYGHRGSRLFEVGRCYYNMLSSNNPFGKESYWANFSSYGRHIPSYTQKSGERPMERLLWAGVFDQPLQTKSWNTEEKNADFFTAKKLITSVCKFMAIDSLEYLPLPPEQFPFLNPTAGALLGKGGLSIGFVGELHPEMAFSLGLSSDQMPIVFELDVECLYTSKNLAKANIRTQMPKFPGSWRDFSFLVDIAIKHEEIDQAIGAFSNKKYLQEWSIVDLFQGKGLPEGKKGMSYRFVFRDAEKTLKDADVDKECELLLLWLKKEKQMSLR